MRLLSSMLFVGLVGGMAFAAPKTALRVVRVMPETHEALMFDKAHNKHVLVEEGKEIDGYRVDEVDDDTVTLTPLDGGPQMVLAGPDPTWRQHRSGAAKPAKKAPAADAAMPQDPYASAAPQDPYADAPTAPIAAGDGGVRTAEAPAAPAPVRTAEAPSDKSGARPARSSAEGDAKVDDKPVRAVEAPGSKSDLDSKAAALGLKPIEAQPLQLPPAQAVTAPSTDNATPAPVKPAPVEAAPIEAAAPTPTDLDNSAWGGLPADTTKPAPKPEPAKASHAADATPKADAPKAAPAIVDANGPTVIAKADVTAAISNFGALASSMRGAFTPAGARLDVVAPDSIVAKAGIQSGDVITSINGQPLRTLDDAAGLYARAKTLKAATIEILRNGKPLTLRLQIQ
ncbi:MAG: PDZ domain-containing protein [Kofleriaceae bacterium]